MDRVILISLATGMLSFHQRYTPVDADNSEKDEMQLASYFSALQHVRDTFPIVESEEIQYSIHEQGCSSWTTGLVKHSSGLYILAFYSKYIRFSAHFWKIVFPIMQKEITQAPLSNLEQLKSKKAFQNILQNAWANCIESLAQKLPFGALPSVTCEVCGTISETYNNASVSIPSLHISMKSPSSSPIPLHSSTSSTTISEYVSPRPKSVEVRSSVEEVHEQCISDHNIPIKGNNMWCCFGPASSVSAVARSSVHLEPPSQNPPKVSLPIPTENSPFPSSIQSQLAIKCIESKNFSQISFQTQHMDNIDYTHLCQQYLTQPSEGKDKVNLWELDKDWNIVFHVCSLQENTEGDELSPPSPLTTLGEEKRSHNTDLQLLSLEDDNPPSPPRKAHSLHSSATNDDLKQIKKYCVSMGPSMCTIFRLSYQSNEQLSKHSFFPPQYLNASYVEEFHYCFRFCDERGWLNEKRQTLLI